MTYLTGTFYDGVNSRGHAGTLQVVGQQSVLRYADSRIDLSTDSLVIEPPLGRLPRKITWQRDGFFAADATPELDQLVKTLGKSSAMDWVAALENRWRVVGSAAFVTLLFILGFGIYGVPKIAEGTAYLLPQSVSAKLGASTLAKLDLALAESKLPSDRQAQLSEYFLSRGAVDELHFRQTKRLGANAFTLSQTTVVFTDELIQLTDDDEELLAVYFHELGHARLLHVERSILQSVAWAVVLTMITGDIGGVGELVLALPLTLGQAAYSRKHEREADDFAVAQLKALGISPLKMATVLERISASHSFTKMPAESAAPDEAIETSDSADTDSADTKDEDNLSRKLLELLSSHPLTPERLAYIREAAQDF